MGFLEEFMTTGWAWPFLAAASSLRRMETFTVVVVSTRRVGLRDLKRGGRGTSVSVVSAGGVGDLDVCVTVGDTAVSSSTDSCQYSEQTKTSRIASREGIKRVYVSCDGVCWAGRTRRGARMYADRRGV